MLRDSSPFYTKQAATGVSSLERTILACHYHLPIAFAIPPLELLISRKPLRNGVSLCIIAIGQDEAQERDVSSTEQMDGEYLGSRASNTAWTALETYSLDHTYEAMDVPMLCLHLPTVPSKQWRCCSEDLHNTTRDSGHDGEWRRGV